MAQVEDEDLDQVQDAQMQANGFKVSGNNAGEGVFDETGHSMPAVALVAAFLGPRQPFCTAAARYRSPGQAGRRCKVRRSCERRPSIGTFLCEAQMTRENSNSHVPEN